MAVGDIISFKKAANKYRIQSVENRRGRIWISCYGPLNDPAAQGGLAFFIGPGSAGRIDPITGRRKKVVAEPIYGC